MKCFLHNHGLPLLDSKFPKTGKYLEITKIAQCALFFAGRKAVYNDCQRIYNLSYDRLVLVKIKDLKISFQ